MGRAAAHFPLWLIFESPSPHAGRGWGGASGKPRCLGQARTLDWGRLMFLLSRGSGFAAVGAEHVPEGFFAFAPDDGDYLVLGLEHRVAPWYGYGAVTQHNRDHGVG